MVLDIEEKIQERHSGDEEQIEVIKSKEQKIIIEAPAGYGKTSTMISKIAYILCNKELSKYKKILALTFSVNSAYKVRKDVASQLPELLDACGISPTSLKNKISATNYHGFCLDILRKYGFLLNENFKSINSLIRIDEEYILERDRVEEEEFKLDIAASEALSEFNRIIKKPTSVATSEINQKMFTYNKYIKEKILPKGYITYNSIISLTLELFDQYNNINQFYQKLYTILVVDELQDTNLLSWLLIQKIIDENKTRLIFLGDPLQRIYGFIGALPNLMTIAKERYNMRSVCLKTNHRFANNPDLLNLDKLIRKNVENEAAIVEADIANINLIEASDVEDETHKIIGLIKGNPESKTAILSRARSDVVYKLIDALESNGINYFYALYTDEDIEYTDFHKKVLFIFQDHLNSNENNFKKKQIKQFILDVKEAIESNPTNNSLVLLLKVFLEQIHINFKFLTPEEKKHLIIDTLQSNSLKQYLGHIDSKIIITTIHAAKGLEWDHVVIPDMNSWNFPVGHICRNCPERNSSGSNCKLDFNNLGLSQFEDSILQELSVFYVGATRARNSLVFTRSMCKISRQGRLWNPKQSCFLNLYGMDSITKENYSTILS